MNNHIYILGISLIFWSLESEGQNSVSSLNDSINFKGQLSSWAHLNPKNPYPLYLGSRYIPQLNYEIQLPESKLVDFEVSAMS